MKLKLLVLTTTFFVLTAQTILGIASGEEMKPFIMKKFRPYVFADDAPLATEEGNSDRAAKMVKGGYKVKAGMNGARSIQKLLDSKKEGSAHRKMIHQDNFVGTPESSQTDSSKVRELEQDGSIPQVNPKVHLRKGALTDFLRDVAAPVLDKFTTGRHLGSNGVDSCSRVPQCKECKECAGFYGYDCTNVATGRCSKVDCDGECYGTPGPPTSLNPPRPTQPPPTRRPTPRPTPRPTLNPTPEPTRRPTPDPTRAPTPAPTRRPTPAPVMPTPMPVVAATPLPTPQPTPVPVPITDPPVPVSTDPPTEPPTDPPVPLPTVPPTEPTRNTSSAPFMVIKSSALLGLCLAALILF